MKRLMPILAGYLGLTLTVAATESPRGSLLELHSCELYAGGCTVSAEATQGGRYMLRVWNFASGQFAGVDLKGLQLAVLQASPDNLAERSSLSGHAVVYLPASAAPAQRDALLAWLKSSQRDFRPTQLDTRIAPLKVAQDQKEYLFTAGDFISVRTAPLESCQMGGCGEALWYEPRSASSLFTVAVNRASEVREPLLKLTWTDSARRSVFLGRFGEPTPARDVFVTLSELCGTAKALF